MKCNDIMTRDVECCLPTDTVVKVAQIMKNHSIGAVPIVESPHSKSLLGIITDRDIVLRVVASACDPSMVKVADVMTRQTAIYDLLTCYEDDHIEQALDLMEQCQIRRLPIVNNNNQVVGIIAQADIATRLKKTDKVAELVEEISKPIAMTAGK